MTTNMKDRFLKAKEAWEYLGCSERSFRYLIADGKLKPYNTPFGKRYKLSELETWMAQYKTEDEEAMYG